MRGRELRPEQKERQKQFRERAVKLVRFLRPPDKAVEELNVVKLLHPDDKTLEEHVRDPRMCTREIACLFLSEKEFQYAILCYFNGFGDLGPLFPVDGRTSEIPKYLFGLEDGDVRMFALDMFIASMITEGSDMTAKGMVKKMGHKQVRECMNIFNKSRWEGKMKPELQKCLLELARIETDTRTFGRIAKFLNRKVLREAREVAEMGDVEGAVGMIRERMRENHSEEMRRGLQKAERELKKSFPLKLVKGHGQGGVSPACLAEGEIEK